MDHRLSQPGERLKEVEQLLQQAKAALNASERSGARAGGGAERRESLRRSLGRLDAVLTRHRVVFGLLQQMAPDEIAASEPALTASLGELCERLRKLLQESEAMLRDGGPNL